MKTDNACEKIISVCGNDCGVCPRHMPKTDDELHKTAELWYRLGFRNTIMEGDEIKCYGCKVGNWCRYDVINCAAQRKIENCGQCEEYPCLKIEKAFEIAEAYAPMCKERCSEEEYNIMRKTSLEKKKNLNNEHRKKFDT